jgi:molybdate transport system ATP-binding protein
VTLTATLRTQLGGTFTLDVAFEAPPGITILFGASGSGKTTVLRCLAGLTVPDDGRIAVGDTTLFDRRRGIWVPPGRRRVGYVFQQLALFPHMTVSANLAYGVHRLPPHDSRREIEAIAQRFRITPLLERKPTAISGGERQRVALARAHDTEPAVLLLDEPLSALDHATTSRIIDDLREWNAAHRIPIVYVTHAHREVFALGERVVAMDQGRVVATGTPQEVMEAPAHEGLAHAAGFENLFSGLVMARRPEAGTMHCRLGTSAVELEVPLASAPQGAPVRIAIRAGDILLANREPAGLSARNVLPGTLASLTREGPTVVAVVDAGPRFVVHLTPTAIDSLSLGVGARVWLIVKTYSCRLVAS